MRQPSLCRKEPRTPARCVRAQPPTQTKPRNHRTKDCHHPPNQADVAKAHVDLVVWPRSGLTTTLAAIHQAGQTAELHPGTQMGAMTTFDAPVLQLWRDSLGVRRAVPTLMPRSSAQTMPCCAKAGAGASLGRKSVDDRRGNAGDLCRNQMRMHCAQQWATARPGQPMKPNADFCARSRRPTCRARAPPHGPRHSKRPTSSCKAEAMSNPTHASAATRAHKLRDSERRAHKGARAAARMRAHG